MNYLQSLEKSVNSIKDPTEKSEEIYVDKVVNKCEDHDKTCQPKAIVVEPVEREIAKPSHFNPDVESISVVDDKIRNAQTCFPEFQLNFNLKLFRPLLTWRYRRLNKYGHSPPPINNLKLFPYPLFHGEIDFLISAGTVVTPHRVN